MLNRIIHNVAQTVGEFLDTLCEAVSRQHFDEPVEITLTRTYEPVEIDEEDYWDQFRVGNSVIFDMPDAAETLSDTVELTEIQMEGVLDQIFGEWEIKEKRQVINPDHLPYDPRMGF